jgi:hypothetical protein
MLFRFSSAVIACILLPTIAEAQPSTLPQFEAASVCIVPYSGAVGVNSGAGQLDYRHINYQGPPGTTLVFRGFFHVIDNDKFHRRLFCP